MALPSGMWTMGVTGRYLRPDGTPLRGYLTFTPLPAWIGQIRNSSVNLAVISQTVQVPILSDGSVTTILVNPNDPQITPGSEDQNQWGYCVREIFTQGPILGWELWVPSTVINGDVIDLAKIERQCQDVYRPADWFPFHYSQRPMLQRPQSAHADGVIL